MTGHIPFTVTAHLTHGYSTAHPWGIALDGLLASQLWQAQVADWGAELDYPSDTDDPPDLPLPLSRCTAAFGATGLWHWAATCSQPVGEHRTEIRHRAHHLDHRAMEDLCADPLPAALPARQGPFRSRHMPLIVTVCRAVTWSGVGDPDRVAELLEPVTAIGKKRAHGEGSVARWEVTLSTRGIFESGHLHSDGTLGRPVPAGCLPEPPSTVPVQAGIRPPYMHPGRQADLYIPGLVGST